MASNTHRSVEHKKLQILDSSKIAPLEDQVKRIAYRGVGQEAVSSEGVSAMYDLAVSDVYTATARTSGLRSCRNPTSSCIRAASS